MTTEGWIINKSSSGSSAPGSAPESPNKNKIKFLCSQGGKILPKPVDGHLKYVGGETRIISVPRDIKFQGFFFFFSFSYVIEIIPIPLSTLEHCSFQKTRCIELKPIAVCNYILCVCVRLHERMS